MSTFRTLSQRCGIAKKTTFNTYTLSGRLSTRTSEFFESRNASDRPIYKLYELNPEKMTTVYLSTKKEHKDNVLSVHHKPLISFQVIEPIKRSKEPIPKDEIHLRIQGASYDVYRLLFELGKKKAKINFLY
jgi:hypothetical protein